MAVFLMQQRDFSNCDYDHWIEIAKERGITLPYWKTKPTPYKMNWWLKKIGMSKKEYFEWDGGKKIIDFIDRNPEWPLRAWVGLLLEEQEFQKRWEGLGENELPTE